MISAERLLEDPPGPAVLAALARAGFGEPARAARELRMIAAHPQAAEALRRHPGSLLRAVGRLPDADGMLVRLERFLRAAGPDALAGLRDGVTRSGEALLWALGGTPFLAEQVIRHPEWAEWLTRPAVLARPRSAGLIAADARRALALGGAEGALDALRLARRREVVLVAVRDLLGLATVVQTLSSLTSIADALVGVALEVAAARPKSTSAAASDVVAPSGLVVLGLGKLGGGELNFSSDIDLVYVQGWAGATGAVDARGLALARELTTALGETTHEGHVYRVDLRLRPEGRAGSLVQSLDAVETYYATRAASWERLALLKARPVAGDRAVGREFARRVAPFVWQRPFGAEEAQKVLRLKTESDRRLAARGLLQRHVKLGRGGIREIELVAQVLQIRQGGALRRPAARGTLRALEALRSAGALAAPECDLLRDAYLFLRDVENKLQMAHDTQTHVLPEDEHELGLLSARLGYRGERPERALAVARLRRDLAEHTAAVHSVYQETLGRLVRSGSAR